MAKILTKVGGLLFGSPSIFRPGLLRHVKLCLGYIILLLPLKVCIMYNALIRRNMFSGGSTPGRATSRDVAAQLPPWLTRPGGLTFP